MIAHVLAHFIKNNSPLNIFQYPESRHLGLTHAPAPGARMLAMPSPVHLAVLDRIGLTLGMVD